MNFSKNLLRTCILLCSLLLAAPVLSLFPAHAQTITGAVTGIVTDSGGAVIVGAHVTAENVDTSVKTEGTTNNAGEFNIQYLQIGTYRVTVEAPGFATQTIPSFALEADQVVKVNAGMTIGASSTNVEVKADATPILNTTDATLAYTFTSNQLTNLPLNGGNFAQAAMFAPGVVASPNGFSGNQAIERNTSFSATVAVAGNRNQENDYTLEGADNNEPQQNLIAYSPSVEALGEVQTVNADAGVSYGNSNGGSIVSVFKSGTSEFHGSAFGYLENYNLDTNSWGNKFSTPIVPKNPYNQIKFGGTFGGPILRGKKLFFFGDYEGNRKHSGGLSQNSVFEANWRTGDFSSLLNPPAGSGGQPLYSPIQLYDTQNNFAPYPNNQVPIVNPVAKYLLAHPELYPLPNATPTDGLMANDLLAPQNSFVVNNQYDIKIDWSPGTANQFSAFYSSGRAYDGTSQAIASTFPGSSIYPTHIGGGSWVHTFSSAIVNQARIGFTRVRWDQGVPTDPSGDFGMKGNSIVGIPFPGVQPYVGFSQQGFGGTNLGTTAGVGIVRDNTFKYSDTLTWQHGHHLLSMGADARRYQQNYVNTGNTGNSGFLGNFSYSGQFSGNPNPNPETGAVLSPGYSPADFVLDRVASNGLSSSLGLIGNRQWRIGAYFEDDWKITPKLTLNLGLRYEFDQPWYEVHDKTANIIFQNNLAVVEYANSVPAAAVPESIVCPTRACYNANWKQFAPRVGFAYQVLPRMVIRGGYAATSFLEGDNFNQRLTSSPPFVTFSSTTTISPSPGNSGAPITVEDGFNPQFSGQGSTTYSVWPQNQQPAYVNQFSLTTEYALTNSLSLSAGYLGETGQHLSNYGYPNQWTIAQANIFSLLPAAVQNDSSQWPASLATAYSNIPGVGTNSEGVLVTGSKAMMNYNGLLMSLRQRAMRGLEFTANYTYSKSLADQTQGNYGGNTTDYFDYSRDYGPANTDIRHNITFNGVYTLPLGHGQTYGAGMNRALDMIAGGWKLSATLVNYSGAPVTIGGPHFTNINGVSDRANRYRRFKIVHRSIANWWGTDPSVQDFVTDPVTGQSVAQCTIITSDNGVCAYGPESNTPGELAYGTARSGTERAPGYRQVDSSLFKDFHVFHEHTVGFRANFYNLFNIASYNAPSSSVQNGNFGQITGVQSPPRQIEFSAHYSF
jgi:hypothetical protein